MSAPAILDRLVFKTSRLGEFCSKRELINQTGHDSDDWPLVIAKELVDNGLDGCEEGGIAPVIEIEVSDAGIVICDNGPGIAPDTVAAILDYNSRVSSREAYVSPTRGAQGNALKTMLAMPFVLDGERGETIIESQGVAHRISFSIDRIRQEPPDQVAGSRSGRPVAMGLASAPFSARCASGGSQPRPSIIAAPNSSTMACPISPSSPSDIA